VEGEGRERGLRSDRLAVLLAEHIGEVLQRRHPVLCARAHQAVEAGCAGGRLMRPRKQEILPPQGDVAQLGLADIVIRGQATVFEEAGQRAVMIDQIAGRARQIAARRLVLARERCPTKHAVHDRHDRAGR
jgi:hypothetical protein